MFSFAELKGRLIVSCQALPDEPLYGAPIMGRMALAAKEGGAAAIRAQGTADIRAIRELAALPVFGLIKRSYADSDIYITPTSGEVRELIAAGCEVIALDMTDRMRPQGERAEDLVALIHAAGRAVLADISTYEEGLEAARIGADAVATTMSGYTPYSPQTDGPDIALVKRLAAALSVPVFAEGRIRTGEEVKAVMQAGAFAPIIGSAITRPQCITASFARALAPASCRPVRADHDGRTG